MTPLVKDYENIPLTGPHSMFYSKPNNTLYFTDSGILGGTSIEVPKGSVFSIDFEFSILKPLAFKCLAYPTGIVVTGDGKIYVSETCANRIVRFVKNSGGIYHCSVFH